MTFLEHVVALGIGTVAAGGILVSADNLAKTAENTPTSSLQAADKYGQCKGMCAEILEHDKQVKAEWLARVQEVEE